MSLSSARRSLSAIRYAAPIAQTSLRDHPMAGDRTTTFLERWVTDPRALVAYSLLLGAAAGTSVWVQHALRGGTLMWVPTLSAIVYYTIAGTAGVQLLRWCQSAEGWAL